MQWCHQINTKLFSFQRDTSLQHLIFELRPNPTTYYIYLYPNIKNLLPSPLLVLFSIHMLQTHVPTLASVQEDDTGNEFQLSSMQQLNEEVTPYRPSATLLYRSFIIWACAISLLLPPFLVFVHFGWPGSPDSCTTSTPDFCWCESFQRSTIGSPGVQQPVNTWSNLYSLFTSFIVAFVVFLDRRSRHNAQRSRNAMRGSNSYVADLYVFIVLFLGLGSMWFHASLTRWGGILDAISVYAFMAFLVVYALRRSYVPSPAIFWFGYCSLVVCLTVVHSYATPRFEDTSMLLVISSLLVYFGLELNAWRFGGRRGNLKFWWFAIISGVVASVFWGLSQTGKLLCNPTSYLQPHGLIWHPLAGVAAVFLFFYWRAGVGQDVRKGSAERWRTVFCF